MTGGVCLSTTTTVINDSESVGQFSDDVTLLTSNKSALTTVLKQVLIRLQHIFLHQ